MIKRIIDIVLAIILLIISFPVIIISIILVFFEDGFPIFYFSKRVGKNMSIFTMPKIRTMYKNVKEIETSKFKSHRMITKIGKILRKFSIDELPQLISVIIGDMSIVGYRPSLESQTELNHLRKEREIFLDKPGITGIAQIKGRDNISDKKKVRYELFYRKKKSFILDIIIILRSFKVIIKSTDVKH